jgi:hypothetical protein
MLYTTFGKFLHILTVKSTFHDCVIQQIAKDNSILIKLKTFHFPHLGPFYITRNYSCFTYIQMHAVYLSSVFNFYVTPTQTSVFD